MSSVTTEPIRMLWDDGGAPLREAADHLGRVDPAMGALIARVGACRLERPSRFTPFQYLARAIVGQQLSGRAASTIFGRVCELYRPRRFPEPAQVLETPPDRLRAAGLSNAKTLAVQDLARFAREGHLPTARQLRRLPADQIIERLTRVRGVGRWTVEMLLIFYLGHPDVLPLTDLGVQKGFALTYRKRKLPVPAALDRFGARWRPYRSVAAWYLWRALELPRG